MNSFRLPDPSDLFPEVEVSGKQLASWKDNPTTRWLLREVSKRAYDLGLTAFSGTEEEFLIRKGEHVALKWLVGRLDMLEAEISGSLRPTEDDE
jgi:hypothetical protein